MLQFRVECLLGPWSICVWILSVHNPAYSDYCAAPRPWCGLVSRGPISRNVQHLPPPLQRTGEVSCDAPTSSSRVTVWSFNFGKCQMLFLKYGLDVNIISAGRVVPQIKPKPKPRCIRSMKRKRNFIELWRLRSMLTDLLFSLRCDTFWFSFCLVIGTSVSTVAESSPLGGEKLQQRMSMVAWRQPRCSSRNSSGFTKECTKATWRATCTPSRVICYN